MSKGIETGRQVEESSFTKYLNEVSVALTPTAYESPSGSRSGSFTTEFIENKLERCVGSFSIPDINERITSFTSLSYLMLENSLLRREIELIKQQINELKERIPEQKVIVLRDISKKEAKEEILKLFSTKRTLYYSDIAFELGLDLKAVVDICNELQQNGEIEVDAGISKSR